MPEKLKPNQKSNPRKKNPKKVRDTSRSKCSNCGKIGHTKSICMEAIKQQLSAKPLEDLVMEGDGLSFAEISALF